MAVMSGTSCISERVNVKGISLKFGRHFLALLLAFFILLSMCFATDRKQLSAALDAVNANLKAAGGKQYDDAIGKEFSEKYLAGIKQCKQSAPSLEPFDTFLKLDADGKVQEALVYPETQLANCARTTLLAGKFTRPPHNDYWINIHMQFKH
jgi:hypothetical protein